MIVKINNERVPAIGLGTWNLRGESCIDVVEDALNLGYRHIDTAQNYVNEAEVGEGIKKSGVDRNEIFLVTKIPPSKLAFENVKSSAEESLEKLKVEYIDLLLIHWPSPSIPMEETLKAMFDLQQEGKVSHIGVSNFSPAEVKEALSIGPVFCNQVEYHPFTDQQENLKLAQENDLLFTAYTPLAHGKIFESEIIKEIAEKYNKTPAQVDLKWLLQQKNVCAIPKAANEKHRKENLDINDFELTDDEMMRISSLM